MTEQDFIKKWNVAFESKEQEFEFAAEMKKDLASYTEDKVKELEETINVLDIKNGELKADLHIAVGLNSALKGKLEEVGKHLQDAEVDLVEKREGWPFEALKDCREALHKIYPDYENFKSR